MSYILDALKKVEREREVGTVPSFGGAYGVAEPTGSVGRWWLLLAALGGVLVTAVGVVFWFNAKPVSPNPQREAVQLQPTPAAAPGPTRAARAVVRGEPQRMIPRPAPALRSARREPVEALSTLVPTPAPAPIKPRAAPPTETAPARSSPAVPSVQPAAAAPESAAAAIDDTQIDLDRLPLLEEMSPTFQSGVPSLRIDVHVHSDTAGRSFVIINGRKYRDGDDLGKGATLVGITAEGIVVDFADERFRLLY